MKKEYKNIEDYIEDDSFRAWVLEEDLNDSQLWENYLNTFPENRKEVFAAKRLLQSLNDEDQSWENSGRQLLFSKIKNSIDQSESEKSLSTYTSVYWKYAASVLLILLLSAIYWISLKDSKNSSIDNSNQEYLVWNEKFVPKGQKVKYYLPDGSVATINSNSTIRYKDGFGIDHREVYLEGEIFFEVTKNESLPFRVITGNVSTTALGTSFNVIHKDNNNVLVQLKTGIVEVALRTKDKNTLKSVILNPGQEVRNIETTLSEVTDFDQNSTFLWLNGVIYFKDTPLFKALEELENWYGVEFDYSKSAIPNSAVSGKFDNDYLENVLESISFTLPLDYKIKGKTVELKVKQKN